MLILIITIIAFAIAFLLLGRNNNDPETNEENFLIANIWNSLFLTYNYPIGDYGIDFSDYNLWLSRIYFITSTFVLVVVLMNLLISIISDTFARIKADYKTIMYMDMLHLIVENKIFFGGED